MHAVCRREFRRLAARQGSNPWRGCHPVLFQRLLTIPRRNAHSLVLLAGQAAAEPKTSVPSGWAYRDLVCASRLSLCSLRCGTSTCGTKTAQWSHGVFLPTPVLSKVSHRSAASTAMQALAEGGAQGQARGSIGSWKDSQRRHYRLYRLHRFANGAGRFISTARVTSPNHRRGPVGTTDLPVWSDRSKVGEGGI